jgi:hypothetical protein
VHASITVVVDWLLKIVLVVIRVVDRVVLVVVVGRETQAVGRPQAVHRKMVPPVVPIDMFPHRPLLRLPLRHHLVSVVMLHLVVMIVRVQALVFVSVIANATTKTGTVQAVFVLVAPIDMMIAMIVSAVSVMDVVSMILVIPRLPRTWLQWLVPVIPILHILLSVQ